MKLEEKYMAVLNEVPNFVTDLTANITGNSGKRTYKYLNLSTILKAIKPIFAKHDLAFRQVVRMGAVGDKVSYGTVETIIFDAEKTLNVGDYPFIVVPDPQAIGSAVTYARRYSLYAALGIFPDKDDDGAAMRDYSTPQQPRKATAQEVNDLNDMAQAAGTNLGFYVNALASQFGHEVRKPQDLTEHDVMLLRQAISKGGNK